MEGCHGGELPGDPCVDWAGMTTIDGMGCMAGIIIIKNRYPRHATISPICTTAGTEDQ
jgi:hypothetical protein